MEDRPESHPQPRAGRAPEPRAEREPEPDAQPEPDATSTTYLGRVDPRSPVSGHVPPADHPGGIATSPEHDWTAAAAVVMPLLRPAGTAGMDLGVVDAAWMEAEATRSHTNQVVIDAGPAGLVVVYALPADGFDVIVNGDHLLAWHADGAALRQAAMANLEAWSASAPWSDEVSGERRVLSSESGDGWDASRILLPRARAYVAGELAVAGRVLFGLPERHLLVAASLHLDDPAFAALFTEFILEHADGAEEPIDRRVFELVNGELVVYAG